MANPTNLTTPGLPLRVAYAGFAWIRSGEGQGLRISRQEVPQNVFPGLVKTSKSIADPTMDRDSHLKSTRIMIRKAGDAPDSTAKFLTKPGFAVRVVILPE